MRWKRVLLVAITLASIATLVAAYLKQRHDAAIEAVWKGEQARYVALQRQLGAKVDEEVRVRTLTTQWEAAGTGVRARVENCPTCHLGVADRALVGDDVPRELRAHPKMELYLEKHPTKFFGCTSCHGGEGTLGKPHPRVVLRAAEKGKKAWALDADGDAKGEPLLRIGSSADLPSPSEALAVPEDARDSFLEALPEIEAGCFKCHSADAELEGAKVAAQGRALFRDLGCQACHAVARMPPPHKPAAPLTDVALRFQPAYVLAYLRGPHSVKAQARMPSYWPAGTDDAERTSETLAIASFLFERSERRARAREGSEPKVARTADVAGASAEDGKLLFEAYGCKACHMEGFDAPSRALAASLATAGDAWTEDWLASWSKDPKALWAGARMPSLRLSPREAASVAKYLSGRHAAQPPAVADAALVTDAARRNERVACAASSALLTRAQCGELLVAKDACLACHDLDGMEPPRTTGPALDGFGARARLAERTTLAKLDSPRAGDPNAKMPDHELSAGELRALMVFLAGLSDVSPRPDADADRALAHRARAEGTALVLALGCPSCHEMGGVTPPVRGAPSLIGEGARVRPEWLFAFLERPDLRGVRPSLHPEWIYGDLVPPAKLSLRMPSYTLLTDDATAIARAFAAEDGATFPFAPPSPTALTPDDRIAAATTLNAQCMGCHYIGELPRERAKTVEQLGPDLGRVSERLRPSWVRSFLPDHARVGSTPAVVDMLFWLRDKTVLPAPGDEARVPVLGLGE